MSRKVPQRITLALRVRGVHEYTSHYRDNRVQCTFANAWRFARAGGIGAVFGKGKANQTTAQTDARLVDERGAKLIDDWIRGATCP